AGKGGVQRGQRDDYVGHHHGHRMNQQSVADPQQRRAGLDQAQSCGLLEEIRETEAGRRDPANPAQHRYASAPDADADEERRVRTSVRIRAHSCTRKPCDSKKRRICGCVQCATSSRIGTSTLSALSLSTVRRAIWVTQRDSETAMVSPSPSFTCSIAFISELPSPQYTTRSGPMDSSDC